MAPLPWCLRWQKSRVLGDLNLWQEKHTFIVHLGKKTTVSHLNHARTRLIIQGHVLAGGPFLASLELIKCRRELTQHTQKDGPHNLNLKVDQSQDLS